MPRRRCVGCGRIAAKSELLRIALASHDPSGAGAAGGQRAVVDLAATMPGRGAYLCRDRAGDAHATIDCSCLQRAIRRGGIARTLRTSVTLDRELVESVSR